MGKQGNAERVSPVKAPWWGRQIGYSEPILVLETVRARYFRQYVLKVEPITGGVEVESRIERVEK